MKKPLPNTKCTVKLRKSEYREEWYLIIESYPVFAYPGAKPSRHKEALNRTITTTTAAATTALATIRPIFHLWLIGRSLKDSARPPQPSRS